MPLIFTNSASGSSHGYVRYMASTASWVLDGENLDFTQAVFDLENIKTGWCFIDAGVAPEWAMDASLEEPAARPSGDGWKRGFKVDIYSKAMFGDETSVREWGTNSTGATMGIQALYAEYEEANKGSGKLPVVEFNGGTPTKVGKGSTNVPKLKILKFIDTPAELKGGASAPVAAAPTSKPDIIEDEF
tara:strand:+ start:496 stop:1059 length:564 start_codon:yes stop_codon:yes gene_type:complete